ncbi:hypothetical protein ACT009_08450 [Sphingomonas sp. Tas61C01]|uniref:hypothetical protein n=1 Tax=Sphingomonas sp. Tas61C01 TaxID=3458297 RepID=UPI00403E8276
MSNSFVAAKPKYEIEDDLLQGVIIINVEGFFDLPTLRAHFVDNAAVVERWRAAGRPIRVLIDAVNLKPHTPEGQACVQEATGRTYRPGDKVAILVCSSLVKMQMRRALSHGEILDFFISRNAALTWLDVQQQSSRQHEVAGRRAR